MTLYAPRCPLNRAARLIVPLLLGAATFHTSAEEITGTALKSALQEQGWQVQNQSNGSSLVTPPNRAEETFVFRKPTPEEAAQAPSGKAAPKNQPEPTPAVAAVEPEKNGEAAPNPGKTAAPVEPAKSATPATARPYPPSRPHPRYNRTGPHRYWRSRPPYRSRAWQRHRHYRNARYPRRGYGYRRGPRYGYSRYYAPPYRPGVPLE